MHTVSTQTIISHTPFLLHSSHSRYQCFASCIFTPQSPLWLSLHSPYHHSVRSDSDRLGGDWPIARLSLRNDLWPRAGSRVGGWGWGMKGERCCFPCSPSGGAALQTRRPSDLSPDEAKLSLVQLPGTPGTPASPKALCIRIPLSRLFILSWPRVRWGYLTPALWVKIVFLQSSSREINPSATKSSISPLKWFLIKLWCPPLSYVSVRTEEGNFVHWVIMATVGECEMWVLGIQFQEYWYDENKMSTLSFVTMDFELIKTKQNRII